MKNLHHVFASLLMLIALNVNAQNQRALMFECFTNTGCAPCASQNPALDALIDANGDRVTAIKYHMSWPGNNDPMYLHNTQDNDSRKSYYSVNAVPHTVVDGIRFANVPSGLNQNMVNQWLAIESPFEMRMTHQLNATQDTITVIVMAKASSDVSGSLKLMVGVIEKEIHYTSAPGSNGERDFYSVMKKLLPSASGNNLGNMAAGDYVSYKFQWALANVYDLNQLSAVAWIQDGTSKEVFQSCKSSDNFEPFYHNDAAMSNISNVKTMICSGVAEPKAVITNFGSNAISNAEIEVLVNDETVKTLSWEGNLPSFASATVDLGEIAFPVELENTLKVQVTTLNGNDDEGSGNNATTLNFNGSPENTGKTIKLTIRTDNNPEETTWKLTDINTNEVILEGGPYDEPNKMYNETLTIPGDGCYDFTIYDAGGNGLTNTTGLYGMKAGNTTLFSGSDFGASESNEFSYEVTANVDDNESVSNIYPNPTTGIISIVTSGDNTVSIYNMAGQCVFQTVIKDYGKIDLSDFGKGIYAIRIGDSTQRIVVE